MEGLFLGQRNSVGSGDGDGLELPFGCPEFEVSVGQAGSHVLYPAGHSSLDCRAEEIKKKNLCMVCR